MSSNLFYYYFHFPYSYTLIYTRHITVCNRVSALNNKKNLGHRLQIKNRTESPNQEKAGISKLRKGQDFQIKNRIESPNQE